MEEPYIRKVQYYETDMMGVAHHANFIHWMEEARILFMDRLGFPYAAMEAKGIISPVRSLSCDYKHTCTFGDEIRVFLSVKAFNGVVMTIGYEMKNQKDETVMTGSSDHMFLHRDGSFARLKREIPEFCEAIDKEMNNG